MPASGIILQVFLVQTRLVTGALWLAIGWHAAWDWSQAQIVDLAPKGTLGGGPALLHVHQNGPLLFVGQPDMIESGLMVLLVTALCLAVACLAGRRALRSWFARLPDMKESLNLR
jgi:hypothetical protein